MGTASRDSLLTSRIQQKWWDVTSKIGFQNPVTGISYVLLLLKANPPCCMWSYGEARITRNCCLWPIASKDLRPAELEVDLLHSVNSYEWPWSRPLPSWACVAVATTLLLALWDILSQRYPAKLTYRYCNLWVFLILSCYILVVIYYRTIERGASLVAQTVKNLPAMWGTWVQSLGWEDALEDSMATHSSIRAWRIPWTEEPGGLQSMWSQSVGHN